VDLNLYDSSGHLIHGGWDWGNVDIAYTKTLTAGTYYAEVDYYSSSNQGTTSTYDLTLTLVPTPDTDNTIATAQNIGVLVTGTKVLQDSITKTTDDKDFYKFELTANAKIDFSLSKLSVGADLNLYNSSGHSIYKSYIDGNWIAIDNYVAYTKTLATGIYFLEVDYRGDSYDPNQATTSTYDLSLTSSKATTLPTDDTIATARNIGVLAIGSTKVLQDSVTQTTDDKDFYQFELTTNSKVDFLLSKLSANVNLNLYNEEGGAVRSSWVSDNSDVSYTQLLAAGTYYAEVDYADSDNNLETSTTYDLSLKTSELKIPDSAGYTQVNLANAVAYLETHQSLYSDQIIL